LRREDVRARGRDLERRVAAVHLGARLAGVDGTRADELSVLDAQVHEVRENRDAVARGKARRDVLAHGRRGDQDGVRCLFLRRGVERPDVSLRAVERQLVPVRHVDDTGAVFPEAARESPDALSRQDGRDGPSRELARERQRFEGSLADLPLALLDEDQELHGWQPSAPVILRSEATKNLLRQAENTGADPSLRSG
jgi:hypothetical protein